MVESLSAWAASTANQGARGSYESSSRGLVKHRKHCTNRTFPVKSTKRGGARKGTERLVGDGEATMREDLRRPITKEVGQPCREHRKPNETSNRDLQTLYLYGISSATSRFRASTST